MLAFFSNLRISAKILLGISLLALLSVFVAGLGAVSLNTTAKEALTLSDRDAEAIRLAGVITTSQNRAERLWLMSVIEHDRADFETLVGGVESTFAKIDESVASLEKLMGEDQRAKFVQLRSALEEYQKQTAKIPPLWYQDRLGDAEDVLQHDSKEPFETADAAANAIAESVHERAVASSVALREDANATIWTLIVVSGIGLLAIVGMIYLLIRKQITGPLVAMTERMGRLAEGDTSIEIQGNQRGDEIGDMARAVVVFRDNARAQAAAAAEKAQAEAEQKRVVETLGESLHALSQGDLTVTIVPEFPSAYAQVRANFNDATNALRDLIGSVMESTTIIRTGSQEIAAASEDLARRTEGNAASLEETSAAVTQMDDRLRATAAAAQRTVERADGAIATVTGGRNVADEAVQAMGRVSESAKGIDSVIEGLDKIAFQTRVLAMNAAVEAGRAGEAGRGFAVVADLVSALAMRAEEESKRARDQLTVTQTDIVAAVDMVQKVDGALQNISGDVSEVHALLGNIATDNQAQSSAITQVSAAIGTMDQTTQQNAAMVEETSAAARNLSSEVVALAERAAKFRVGNTHVSALSVTAATRSTQPAPAKASVKAVESKATTPARSAADAAKTSGEYRSPVKALPGPAPSADGGEDWTSF